MRNRQILWAFLVIVVFSIGGYTVVRQQNQATVSPSASASATPLVNAKVLGVSGQTALQTLKNSFAVETKEYPGMGEYVYAVDGHAQDEGHYWSFQIDGKAAEVGAGSYISTGGESLEFVFTAL